MQQRGWGFSTDLLLALAVLPTRNLNGILQGQGHLITEQGKGRNMANLEKQQLARDLSDRGISLVKSHEKGMLTDEEFRFEVLDLINEATVELFVLAGGTPATAGGDTE